MGTRGEALNRKRPAQAHSASTPSTAGPAEASASSLKTLLNRLVISCVGGATLAVAAGTAWRDGLGAGQIASPSAHTLMAGLEIDLAAGGATLLAGLWLAARLRRRSSAALAQVAQALADLAADPDPNRSKPLDVGGDFAGLARAYNDVLIGMGRRERQLLVHTMAQAEKTRLTELATLRQDISAPLETAKDLGRSLAYDGRAPAFARREHRMAEALGRIGESVLATFDDLIDRPQASPNSFDLQSVPVDLAELAEDVCNLLWAQAMAKGLDLAVYIDPGTPGQISTDPVRLRQIIAGLAGSALAVTSDGGVLIEVEPDSPTSVRISVHDTGPALTRSPDDPELLRPQTEGADAGRAAVGDSATRSGFQLGARLGDTDATLPGRLAAYRQMVKAMGGAFAPIRHRDRGATFSFRIPAQVNAAPAPWAGAAQVSAPAARVLLAVNGPCTRRTLSRYLARAGLAVSVHDKGERDAGEPVAGASFAIGDDAGLDALGPLTIPTIRLAPPKRYDDRADGLAASDVVLNQPLCRAELEALLRKFKSGRLTPSGAQAPAAAMRGEGRLAAPFVAAGAPALTDDERALLADLDGAAERDEFSLAYQPQVEREGERILGVEALLRWTHPTRGAVSPAVFIPLAEATGRVADVTAWVVDRVLAETHYLSGLQVSFNASALEFAQTGFVDRLLAAIADTGYDARRLEVEITETAILQHATPVRESMDRLHAAGIGVALDDFGAGYSSLSHLRRYPFDKLKIDREFITDCSRDMESATVVHAVVSIGRALGMKVIAEGVETETQRNFLRIAGVYAMQGYLFGKPVPIDNLARLITPSGSRAWG